MRLIWIFVLRCLLVLSIPIIALKLEISRIIFQEEKGMLVYSKLLSANKTSSILGCLALCGRFRDSSSELLCNTVSFHLARRSCEIMHFNSSLDFNIRSRSSEWITYNRKDSNISCNKGWFMYNSSCFYVEQYKTAPWSTAVKKCEGMKHAYLAEVDSVTENSFLERLIVALGEKETNSGFWIGGLSTWPNIDTWVWSRGGDLKFTRFVNAERGSNFNTYVEQCIYFTHFGWRSSVCTDERLYICEEKAQEAMLVF